MLNFKRSKLFLMLMSAVAVQTSAKEVQLVETDINDDGYLITQQNLPLFVQDKTNLITQNNRYLFTQDNSNLLAQDNRRFFAQDNSTQNSRALIKDDDLVIQSSRSFTAQDYNNLLAQNNQNFFVADNSDLVVRSSRPLVKLDNRDIIVRDRRSTITQDDNALVVQGSRPLLAQINHDLIENLIEPEQRDLMTLDNAHLLVQDNRRVIAKDNSHLLVQNSHRLVAQGNSDLVEPEQRDLITSDDDHLIAQDNSQLIAQNNSELTARNSDFTTFNAASLFGGQTNVDLSGFTSRNFISPGHYLVQLSVNSNDLSNDITVQFDHLDGQRSAVLCLDAALLDRLDLKPEIREALPNKPCLTMKELDPDAYYDFDFAELKLALSIPQALRVERPEGYIDPKLFSNGVNSGFIGYAFNYNRDEDRESKYLGLNGGLNVAGWYYRHAGAFESKDSGLGQYYSDQNVIYRDITPMNSRLSLGQFNTTTYRLDNLPIVGAQISSDQDMLPWSYRQYAPVIENFAYTNAVVRVYQNAQKIYERTVPRGAFKINDLKISFEMSDDISTSVARITELNKDFNIHPNTSKPGRVTINGEEYLRAEQGIRNAGMSVPNLGIALINKTVPSLNIINALNGSTIRIHFGTLTYKYDNYQTRPPTGDPKIASTELYLNLKLVFGRPTCTMSNQTVNLAPASTSILNTDQTANQQSFNISFDCSVAMSGNTVLARVTDSYTPNNNNSNGILKNQPSLANKSNVDVQLMDDTNTPLTIGTQSTFYKVPADSTATSFIKTLKARYYRSQATAKPGYVQTQATVFLDYQ